MALPARRRAGAAIGDGTVDVIPPRRRCQLRTLPSGGRSALLVPAGVMIVLVTAGCGVADTAGTASRGATVADVGHSGAASASVTPSVPASDNDNPAVFATSVRTYARQANIDAHLLMAILYNESYKPHDPAFERAWHQIQPDSAFGVANMHQKAFDDTKRGRDFSRRSWDELPDDPALAIEAAAWYLHELAAKLPSTWPAPYPKDDLLALGYNAGPGNMLAFARGTRLLPLAQTYLQRLHENWAIAASALAQR
jgi:hypothetical protein